MNFNPMTQNELKKIGINDGDLYQIEYMNRDYFNGLDTIEKAEAKAIIQDGEISFIVMDPFGMEKFIKDVRVL